MNASNEFAYRYALLRYVHDRRTEEFVNVGVVLEAPGFFGCKVDSSFQRLSNFFPGVATHSIRASLRAVQTHINNVGLKLAGRGEDLFKLRGRYIEEVWRSVLPRDDSALAWSPMKMGITSDPAATLLHVFKKDVSSYKHKHEKGSRSDADVWAVVEPYLSKCSVSKKLVEHHVQGSLSEYTFEHALKNGAWHCIEPVSIDLMHDESIRGKVQKLYGAMSLIKSNAQDLKVYFVLSEPTTVAAKKMFSEARDVVASVDVKHQVFIESESHSLAMQLAQVIGH